MTREAEHTCHAEGCGALVPPRLLMCGRHWRIVPRKIKFAVLATYQPGQERLDGTATPSRAYLEAARDAVEAVAVKERRRRPSTLPGLDGGEGR